MLKGFFGVGKTTLLNQRLKVPASGSTARITNEFSDVGLDHDQIEEITKGDPTGRIMVHTSYAEHVNRDAY